MENQGFFEANEDKVQAWLVGYKKGKVWASFNVPGDVSRGVVETLLNDLNSRFDTIYSRKIMGAVEKDNHPSKKGEFLGL